MSTTSKDCPSHSKWSPVAGTRPRASITYPYCLVVSDFLAGQLLESQPTFQLVRCQHPVPEPRAVPTPYDGRVLRRWGVRIGHLAHQRLEDVDKGHESLGDVAALVEHEGDGQTGPLEGFGRRCCQGILGNQWRRPQRAHQAVEVVAGDWVV